MQCPRCNNQLASITYEGAEIETCPGCGGEWLDEGELKHIVQTVEESFSPEMREALDAVNTSTFVIEKVDKKLACPKCPGVELNHFNYAGSSGVILDKCPQCAGIWLDKDELEHVQILVEEWHGKLEEDMARFAPMLSKVRQEAENAPNTIHVSSFGVVNAVLRRIMRFI